MFNKNDTYRHIRNFRYKCNECGTIFTYWMLRDDDWYASGFDWKAVCKKCFEKRVPNPRFMTVDEYARWHREEYGFVFLPDIENRNKKRDRRLRKLIKKLGTENGVERMYPPEERTEPKVRRWECMNCRAEIILPFGIKPPEICEVCGK